MVGDQGSAPEPEASSSVFCRSLQSVLPGGSVGGETGLVGRGESLAKHRSEE